MEPFSALLAGLGGAAKGVMGGIGKAGMAAGKVGMGALKGGAGLAKGAASGIGKGAGKLGGMAGNMMHMGGATKDAAATGLPATSEMLAGDTLPNMMGGSGGDAGGMMGDMGGLMQKFSGGGGLGGIGKLLGGGGQDQGQNNNANQQQELMNILNIIDRYRPDNQQRDYAPMLQPMMQSGASLIGQQPDPVVLQAMIEEFKRRNGPGGNQL